MSDVTEIQHALFEQLQAFHQQPDESVLRQIASLPRELRQSFIGAAVMACQRQRWVDEDCESWMPAWQDLSAALKPDLPGIGAAELDQRRRFALWVQLHVMAFEDEHHSTQIRYLAGAANEAEAVVLLQHLVESSEAPEDIVDALSTVRNQGSRCERLLRVVVRLWHARVRGGEAVVNESTMAAVLESLLLGEHASAETNMRPHSATLH